MNRRPACAEASAVAEALADKSVGRWTRMDANIEGRDLQVVDFQLLRLQTKRS
jgi:hypothetical protein